MESPPTRQFWLFASMLWMLLGLLAAAQNAAWRGNTGLPVDWGEILPMTLGDWLTCALFTPVFYLIVQRWPIRAGQLRQRIPVHLFGAVMFAVAKSLVWTPLYNLLAGRHRSAFDMLFTGFYADILTYWAAIGVLHAMAYARESRERQVESTRLALDSLRAQLQPHFLFNTLQSISTLIYRDARGADHMLTQLSDLLRLSLKTQSADEVELSEELAFLERYLGIMRVRFGDRLRITRDVAAATMSAKVPGLLLQPLVENAIEHGMRDRTDIGHVSIRARDREGRLCLEIADDGPGFSHPTTPSRTGIGLANARERLIRLYGDAGQLDIERPPQGGLVVRIVMPFRRD